MKCPYAPSGCNYPEAECLGLCPTVNRQPPAEEPCVFATFWLRLCVGGLCTFIGVVVLLATLTFLWLNEAALRPLFNRVGSEAADLVTRLFWHWANVNF